MEPRFDFEETLVRYHPQVAVDRFAEPSTPAEKIAIVVLVKSQWPIVRRQVARVVLAVNAATPGSYTEADISEAF